METEIVFTPDNLISNIEKLGPWSGYYLAEIAINHYFPEIKDIEDVSEQISQQVKAIEKLGGKYWTCVVKKYHLEIGYVQSDFKEGYVNEN